MNLLDEINNTPTTTLEEILSRVSQEEEEGILLEFGVAEGGSLRYISGILKNLSAYGFDSFEGLPEDWRRDVPKGSFKCSIPTDFPDNVQLVVGMFQDILPSFLEKNKQPIKFIHIDCDIYSSTKFVLECLKGRLNNTIIAFDELIDYDSWEDHEYKALCEFIRENDVQYECLGKYNTQKVAFKVSA